ncbi:MAG: HAD-IA family hydrolase [Pseudomonadales bacterium]
MIKAVLWDFGGVLTSSPFEAFNRFETEKGLPQNFIRSINATNPDTNAWAQFESNKMSIDAFDAAFASESRDKGHEIPGKDVLALLSGDIRPKMVAALRKIKQSYAVGCITNNVKSGKGAGMARSSVKAKAVSNVMALFDVVIESSVIGLRKPDPKIYQLTCEEMGVDPCDALFIDDLGINLKPAKAMGMQTIKVLNESQALHDLSSALNLDFSDIEH